MTSGGAENRPWNVVATSRFERDLARLPPRVATAVVEFVTAAVAHRAHAYRAP